jgi:phosphoribosylglycinamide formyltransferase 1
LNSDLPRQPIVILISGRGSNMRALIEQSRSAAAPYVVVKVFSDKPAAAGLEAARILGIPVQAVPGTPGGDRAAYDRELAAAIRGCSPRLIVLAGFMRILSAQFIAEYRGRILNIHPSLLPKHPGLHTHRRVLEARETQHGATVHFVTEQLDAGPAVIQSRVAVTANDDEASLTARVHIQEHRIYPLAVRWFCEGRLRYEAGQAWLDGKVLSAPIQLTEEIHDH